MTNNPLELPPRLRLFEPAIPSSASLDSISWRQRAPAPAPAPGPEDPISSSSSRRRLPTLPQKHFVHLWRTLHDLFLVQSDNSSVVDLDVQKLYHSVSVVGTLLLQIGEVGQRVQSERREGKRNKEEQQQEEEKEWEITFQQFIAREGVAKRKKRRRNRTPRCVKASGGRKNGLFPAIEQLSPNLLVFANLEILMLSSTTLFFSFCNPFANLSTRPPVPSPAS